MTTKISYGGVCNFYYGCYSVVRSYLRLMYEYHRFQAYAMLCVDSGCIQGLCGPTQAKGMLVSGEPVAN